MTDLTITGVKRTVDETRELIRRLHEIGNPQLSLKLEELSVVDDLYFFHVVIGKEKVLHLKLKLNFGPADFHLTYDQVHLIEKPYEESFPIWQHVIQIRNEKAPFNEWHLRVFQVDEMFNNSDLDLVLLFMYFNMEWRRRLTIRLEDRYDLVIHRNCVFFVFEPGFKFIANEIIFSISHGQFLDVIGKSFLKFQHLLVSRYDCCRGLKMRNLQNQCEIETLSLFSFPTKDVFEIIKYMRNLKRLNIISDLYDGYDGSSFTVRKSEYEMYPKIAREFISRQHADFILEISENIYIDKPYKRLIIEILREFDRIRIIHFLSGGILLQQMAAVNNTPVISSPTQLSPVLLSSVSSSPPSSVSSSSLPLVSSSPLPLSSHSNSKILLSSPLPPILASFLGHRNYDPNLIGIISSMVGIRPALAVLM